MIKTKYWVFGIFVLLLISGTAILAIYNQGAPGTVANIYVDGQCIRSIDLDNVKEQEVFTVTCEAGYNEVCIEPGRICMTASDCPDQICVNTGWLADSAAPIVCLPHHVVIQLEKTAALNTPFDAVSQ